LDIVFLVWSVFVVVHNFVMGKMSEEQSVHNSSATGMGGTGTGWNADYYCALLSD